MNKTNCVVIFFMLFSTHYLFPTTSSLNELYNTVYHSSFNKKHHIKKEFLYTSNNEVSDLIETRESVFEKMKDMIQSAKDEVTMTTFVWKPDSKASDTLLEGIIGLEKKLKKLNDEDKKSYSLPIKLQLVIDKRAGYAKKFLDIFKRHSEDTDFNFFKKIQKINPKLIEIQIAAYYHTSVGLTHSKYLLIDKKTLLVTSANIEDSGNYELGVVVNGPSLRAIQLDFKEMWSQSEIEIANADYLMHKKTYNVIDTSIDQPFSGNTDIIVSTRKSCNNFLYKNDNNPQNQSFLYFFKTAKNNIHIMTPNLNFKHYRSIFMNTLKRGVDIHLILSKEFNQKLEKRVFFQGGTNDRVASILMKNYQKLINKYGKKNIGKLDIRWYTAPDGVYTAGGRNSSHAKFMSIDNEVTIIGSANMDTQSWYHSRELNLIIGSSAKTLKWNQKIFNPIFKRSIPFYTNRN